MSDVMLMGDPRVAAVPVVDAGDELVDLRTVPDLAVDDLKADVDGAFALLRSGLVDRLLDAQDRLPADYHLLLVEGYRPYALQNRYFTSYQREIEATEPTLDHAETFRLASRYVSPPEVAPHVSGAAIDLTLADADGNAVDMGTEINATPEASRGGCYFAADNISPEARRHRELLDTALGSAGLVNYPTEWWHWSYGDRYWAVLRGAPSALYGPVDPASSSRT
jgi:zinc D-Ala-D-Ala dipeptidase